MVETFGYTMTPQVGSEVAIYDENFELASIARRAFNVTFKDEFVTRTKGMETLTFEIANSERSYLDIQAERLVEFGGRWFRIKLLEDTYYSRRVTRVTCYAVWNEMSEGAEIVLNFTNTTLSVVLDVMSQGTNITFKIPSNLQNKVVKGLTSKRNSVLYQYRYILKQYGLETLFGYEVTEDGIQIIAIPQMPAETKIEWPLVVGKTLSDIRRIVDSRDLCTRYTLIGQDSELQPVTVASINDGKEYLEDFSWFDAVGQPRRIISATKEDNRFTIKESMLTAMEAHLAIYSKPFVTYEVSAVLYADKGIPDLLHSQLILDENFLITEWRRISSRNIVYSELHRSAIVFEDPRQDLVDVLNGTDDY